MSFRALTIIVAVCPVWANAAGKPLTTEELFKRCEKKVIVFGRDEKGEPVGAGERLDSYCEGYLDATFEALIRAGAICLKPDSTPPTPEFLLSTARQYRADVVGATDAATAIEGGFKRAYRCNR
jgi:hypothetical protein